MTGPNLDDYQGPGRREQGGALGKALSRREVLRILGVAGAAGAGAAAGLGGLRAREAAAGNHSKPTLATPTIACGGSGHTWIDISFCAGADPGAPNGFTLQWMKFSDFVANGNQWDAACDGGFSGSANESRYNLGASQCAVVRVGDLLLDNGAETTCRQPLEPCTEYVFRAFAHAIRTHHRSQNTANLVCSTSCSHDGCTYTQGYWKTHGPAGCATGNNTNEWPVTWLTLGSVPYADLQLCSVLNTPAGGNGLISLAHQLIAAKLNIANGADGSAVAAAIASADALIGDLVVPPVGSGSLHPSVTSALTTTLDNYNGGAIGPGHCG